MRWSEIVSTAVEPLMRKLVVTLRSSIEGTTEGHTVGQAFTISPEAVDLSRCRLLICIVAARRLGSPGMNLDLRLSSFQTPTKGRRPHIRGTPDQRPASLSAFIAFSKRGCIRLLSVHRGFTSFLRRTINGSSM
jgi:hypothetical protein